MGIISEVIEGVIKGISNIFKNKKSNNIDGWEKLSHLSVPHWVELQSHKFHNKHPIRFHDLRKDFIGKHYIYRIIYKRISKYRVVEEYYRKKKD